MAMFQYENYILPALLVIPGQEFIYSFITIDEVNGFACLTIANKIGYVNQNGDTYSYTLGEGVANQFSYRSYIAALTPDAAPQVNIIFGTTDITDYSWKQFLKVNDANIAPLAGQVIWSNFNLRDSNGNIIKEMTNPQKVPKAEFSLRNLLLGVSFGLIGQPFSLWKGNSKNNLTLLEGNYSKYPYAILGSLDDKLGEKYASLIISDKPFIVQGEYVVATSNTQCQYVFTDYKSWIKVNDAYWLNSSYNTGEVAGRLGHVLWCNYDLKNEYDQVQIKGKEDFPLFF